MRKLSFVLAICVVLLCFAGCGNNNVKIEDHTWQMLFLAPADDGSNILYASPAYLEAFPTVEGIEALDLTVTAKDGILTITDNTNGQTYEGTYEETGEDKLFMSKDKDTSYNITIGDKTGIATAYNEYPTKGADVGSYKDRHALFIMIDGYSLQLLADGVFEADFPAE